MLTLVALEPVWWLRVSDPCRLEAMCHDVPVRLVFILALAVSTASFAQVGSKPARLLRGEAPPLPVQNIAGGQVFVEAAVDRTGSVTGVTVLRTIWPFEELVTNIMHGWRFTPAEGRLADGTAGPVDAKVLVAVVFRPPTLVDGPSIGESPRDVALSSERVPFPITIAVPPYPPLALEGGVVVLEVEVRPDGSVGKSLVVRSGPGFDGAASDAIRQWRFRPARSRGNPVSSVAYVIFGFSQPIIIPPVEPQRR